MKYALISYIALGLVLSLALGVEYNCEGQEMFPDYYGSPFVFKQKSLGSSMEYYYSISGLLLNILAWSVVLFFLDKAIQTLIQKLSNPKFIHISYKVIIGFMIVFTTLHITILRMGIGYGFDKNLNYWYWDLNKEAKAWGVTCNGKLLIFGIAQTDLQKQK